MKTLVEWKVRLYVGAQVKQTWNSREGNVEYLFTIDQVQSNGLWAKAEHIEPRRSWMEFPKRDFIVFTEDGWIKLDRNQTPMARYIWI
jgi:hypothetical protein